MTEGSVLIVEQRPRFPLRHRPVYCKNAMMMKAAKS